MGEIHFVSGPPTTGQWRVPLVDPKDGLESKKWIKLFYEKNEYSVDKAVDVKWHGALTRAAMKDTDEPRIAGIAAAYYGGGLQKNERGNANRRGLATLLANAIKANPDMYDLWQLAGRWARDGDLSSSSLPGRPDGAPQALLQWRSMSLLEKNDTFESALATLLENGQKNRRHADQTFTDAISKARAYLAHSSAEARSAGIAKLLEVVDKLPLAWVNSRSNGRFAASKQLLEHSPAQRIITLVRKAGSNVSQAEATMDAVISSPEEYKERVAAREDSEKDHFFKWLETYRAAESDGEAAQEKLGYEQTDDVDESTVVDKATADTGSGTMSEVILTNMALDAEEGVLFNGQESPPEEDSDYVEDDPEEEPSLLAEGADNDWPDFVNTWMSECMNAWVEGQR